MTESRQENKRAALIASLCAVSALGAVSQVVTTEWLRIGLQALSALLVLTLSFVLLRHVREQRADKD